MKNITKFLGIGVMLSALLIPVLSLKAQGTPKPPKALMMNPVRLENRASNTEQRIEQRVNRASSTEGRLENRENNIERIRARIASTTASTSEKRMEKLQERLQKQQEQMAKVREKLQNKQLKVVEVLGKIADKIQERIDILETKALNMTAAKAKLAEATTKIDEVTTEADNLATLISTEITEENKDSLFTSIKSSQEKIRSLAKEAHALLVDTIKEITKVLPAKLVKPATTTATTTN